MFIVKATTATNKCRIIHGKIEQPDSNQFHMVNLKNGFSTRWDYEHDYQSCTTSENVLGRRCRKFGISHHQTGDFATVWQLTIAVTH